MEKRGQGDASKSWEMSQRIIEQVKKTPVPAGRLMTPEQCAEFLQIELGTLYVMKSQRRIPYRKVGHLLRFDRDEIIEWTRAKEE